MKQVSVAGKALTLLFSAAFLVACSSTDTKEEEAAAAAAAAAAEAEAAEAAAREAERQAAAEAAAAQRELEQAAMAAGTVFYFDFDSSTLKPAAQAALDAHIAVLQNNDRSVRLEGHTDERGTRDYMVVNGVASYRIETVSYGEEQPVAYGSGEGNWSQNRRVELK